MKLLCIFCELGDNKFIVERFVMSFLACKFRIKYCVKFHRDEKVSIILIECWDQIIVYHGIILRK